MRRLGSSSHSPLLNPSFPSLSTFFVSPSFVSLYTLVHRNSPHNWLRALPLIDSGDLFSLFAQLLTVTVSFHFSWASNLSLLLGDWIPYLFNYTGFGFPCGSLSTRTDKDRGATPIPVSPPPCTTTRDRWSIDNRDCHLIDRPE